MYYTEASLFFNTILERIDALSLSWHEIKHSVAVEIVLLYLQPFTNSHFHFFVIVESATSQVLLQRLRQLEVRWGRVKTVEWMVSEVSSSINTKVKG
jgi:hypothetical protein